MAQDKSGERAFRIRSTQLGSQAILARLGPGGPVLRQTLALGFDVFSGGKADLALIDTLPDRSSLIQMGVVLSPVPPEVRVEISLIVGGVIFEDGSVVLNLQSLDFLPLGETSVRFLRAPAVQTSVCHKLKIWQGESLVGNY
jgi:hypothetical protein